VPSKIAPAGEGAEVCGEDLDSLGDSSDGLEDWTMEAGGEGDGAPGCRTVSDFLRLKREFSDGQCKIPLSHGEEGDGDGAFRDWMDDLHQSSSFLASQTA